MRMIKYIDYTNFNNILQIGHIYDHPGDRIDRPLHRNFQLIIVTVSVEIIALPEDLGVLFGRQMRGIKSMGGGKGLDPSYGQFRIHS